MLPQQARVLLVQADRVRDGARAAGAIDEVGVEIADLADAVAPERERVRAGAEPVLAGVEVRAPGVHRVGLAVGDDHLGARARGAGRAGRRSARRAGRALPADRSPRAATSGTTRSRCPSTVKLTPSGCVIAIGRRSSRSGHGARRVGAVGLERDRLDVHLLELEHAQLVDVDVRDQALDRMRVAVVARLLQRGRRRRARRGGRARPRARSRRDASTSICTSEIVLHPAPPQRLAPARRRRARPRRRPRSPRA